MKYLIFFSFSTLLLFQCVPYSPSSNFVHGPNAQHLSDDGCYAKALIPDSFEIKRNTYFEYLGDIPYDTTKVETVVVEVKSAMNKWVKTLPDGNCHSPNLDDCFVWCFIDTPAEKLSLLVVKDTSLTKNFKFRTIEHKTLVRKGGVAANQEVLCEEELTKEVVLSIQQGLSKLGYYELEPTGDFDDRTKQALKNYQQSEMLPIGTLNLITLDRLGVMGI